MNKIEKFLKKFNVTYKKDETYNVITISLLKESKKSKNKVETLVTLSDFDDEIEVVYMVDYTRKYNSTDFESYEEQNFITYNQLIQDILYVIQ